MQTAFRAVRLIQIGLLVSVVMYVLVGERVGGRMPATVALYYAISFVSISIVGAILVVRRTLLARSEAQLLSTPEDNLVLARWKIGYIAIYVLSESLALFGLVLRIFGFSLAQTWSFYLGAVALLLLFGPRQPKAELGA